VAIEIERKFLLRNDNWRAAADGGTPYRQGYLSGSEQGSVRIRIEGDVAKLNIKSATLGVQRLEYEYPIPIADAEEMLTQLCPAPLVEKRRYHLHYAGRLWEIDEFYGDNAGLVVAEVELESVDAPLQLPEWVGEEVSYDPRYYNSALAKRPWRLWGDQPT